ncbi:MAG: hypothetical protein A2041_04745 [Bacteroidetes bacterium GWA2_31_9b]|nr:MAG: hypothetical protein A2041_04745 [Bacteroidetes bacterium GWA2_31_9b]
MILIADSGSTKTDWVLIDNEKVIASYTTQGLNPFFKKSSEISEIIKPVFTDQKINESVEKIFFYGAGCSSEQMKEVIFNGIKPIFSTSEINIETDLLAAARALFKNDQGIAVILGTGASTCLYNGTEIIQNIKSLGYVFGDEGGGDHLGKLFITDFLNNNLSDDIKEKFENTFHLSKDDILRKVYREPLPNSFLASFCEFISNNSEHKQIDSIIKKSFNQLFKNHICKYPEYKKYKIRVLGSTGFYFEKQLKEIAAEFKLKIDLILKNPIKELVDYHLKFDLKSSS